MKVLIDTCVAIDFLQKRSPFADAAYKIFYAAATGEIAGYITAKAATDIYYLMHRFTHSNEKSRTQLGRLLLLIGMLDTSSDDVVQALSADISDFEDAVMSETAVRCKMDCIVTRNISDYAKSTVPVFTPDEFLDILNKKENTD